MLSYCIRCNARGISRHGQEEQKADAKTNTNAGQKQKRTQIKNKRNTKDKHIKKGILERMGTGSRVDLGERPGLESYMHEALG